MLGNNGGVRMMGSGEARIQVEAYFERIENSRRRWLGHEHDPDFERRLSSAVTHGGPGVRLYFDPTNGFAGKTFDLLGRAEPAGSTVITPDDLLALTLLDVRLRPVTVRDLLEDRAAEATGFLSRIHDVPMWSEDAGESLQWANAFWFWLCDLDGVGWVIAGKLLARLRPHLIPVYDSVVKKVLAPGPEFWRVMACPHPGRLLVGVDDLRREGGLPDDYPTLRVIDAAVWMLGSRAKNVNRFRDEREEAISPDFAHHRTEFWRAVGAPDPLAAG